MAIAHRETGAAVNGINSVTPTVPTSQLTGDMMLLIAVGKPFDLGWSVGTTGWNALGSGASGTTAAGVDAGSMKAQVWWKEATSDTEANPTVTEGTPTFNVVMAAVTVFSKAAGETWNTPVVVYGADETDGTAISVTFASDPGVTAGDYVVTFCGVNTDAIGPLTGNGLTPAQTGVTFGATTKLSTPDATWETSTGGDMTFGLSETPVSSGTGSAAPTATATGTASGGDIDRLEAGFIRLRVTVPPSLPGSPSRTLNVDWAIDRSFTW